MNRLIGIAGAMLLVLLFVVPAASAAGPSARDERVVITSGADITLPADQTVDVFIVYNGTARIEGYASTIFVVNGVANLVGAHAGSVIAIKSRVALDPSSRISGDVRALESSVAGATAATVSGSVRGLGADMLSGWRDLGWVLLLVYVAFVVSALVAGLVLVGVAGRQVHAASALISHEPVMVLGAAFAGLIGLLIAGIISIVTVLGIPFGIGLLAIVLPALFVVGYIVAGIRVGETIVRQFGPLPHERPYLTAAVGLALVGLVSVIPPIGGLVSFVGFGSVMLLSWRALRGVPGRSASSGAVDRVAEATS